MFNNNPPLMSTYSNVFPVSAQPSEANPEKSKMLITFRFFAARRLTRVA